MMKRRERGLCYVCDDEEDGEGTTNTNMSLHRQYEFSLENWVITGLQRGFTNQPRNPPCSSSSSSSSSYLSSGLLPSCPPYWMMFSSPQQSRLASRHSSDFWEPNPRQRSRSLNLSVLRSNTAASESEEEEDAQRADTCQTVEAGSECPAAAHGRGQRKAQKAFVPDLLNPPACLSSLPHQRRKNLRQCSLSGLDTPFPHRPNADSMFQSLSSHRAPSTWTRTLNRVPTISTLSTAHTPAAPQTGIQPDSCRFPLASPPPRGLPSFGSDSSVELLTALSPEERELLEAITAQGYSLRTAILALQRTGQQTPDQILTYLVACDHLCQLGYDMVQVEEALEMFQNCETKAQEFLHLLSQFNEMGFQQNAIKEVLLVHENHREKALEELMMRVA
ncbi:uncharacterized protein ubap1lb [Brachyistius frenatus]|uniref:uncharacterized protein ubap1lb n=1 Tax=Brachyistius frenatus TaxID=100188 RepID=UPI0037E88B70